MGSDHSFVRPGVAAAVLVLSLARVADAQDFAIESRVFSEDATEPDSESWTAFVGGLVYDFLDEPAETTVLDPERGRFTVLDGQRSAMVEITIGEVRAFSESVRDRGRKSEQPLLKFLSDPTFESSFADDGRIELVAPLVAYRAATVEADADLVSSYRQYADWQAQLNGLLNPGSPPPFARLALNSALAEHGRLPTQIELEVRRNPGDARPSRRRAEHRVHHELPRSIAKRVDAAHADIKRFKRISLVEYRRAQLAAKAQ